MPELIDLTLTEAAHALREGIVSSRELVQAYLKRIEQLDGQIRAYITVTPEAALAQADQADRQLSEWRRKQAEPLPVLCGIPAGGEKECG